jgi:precorrin-6B methylase 2
VSSLQAWSSAFVRWRGSLASLAVAAACVACAYPSAPPAAWQQIDRERPLRRPDVPYEPSSDAAIAAMLELARPTPADVVYDLGCGDGRVVVEAVRQSGARGVCVDLDPKLVQSARVNAARAGVESRIEFRVEDLFATNLQGATVVMLFLWPDINRKLLPKLQKELPPGARIVSNMHDMGELPPARRLRVGTVNGRPHEVYLWRQP